MIVRTTALPPRHARVPGLGGEVRVRRGLHRAPGRLARARGAERAERGAQGADPLKPEATVVGSSQLRVAVWLPSPGPCRGTGRPPHAQLAGADLAVPRAVRDLQRLQLRRALGR